MEKEEKETTPRFEWVNIEKRKHPRFLVHLRVEYWRINDSKSHTGRVVDISEGGLLLYLSEPVGVGQNLRLKIFIGSGLLKFLEAEVRVVWKQFEKDRVYRIGAKFIHISPEEMIKLKILLNNLLNVKNR